MITAEHERAQAGDGERFADCVSLDFCAPDEALYGLIRINRQPNAGSAKAFAVLFARERESARCEIEREDAAGDWDHASLDGVQLEIVSPLESWRASLEHESISLELEARAVSPPLQPGADLSTAAIGGDRYEQVCELSGTIDTGDGARALRCIGRRVHCWGEPDWGRFELLRSLYAASEAMRAVVVTSARPVSSKGHDDEVRVAHLVTEDEDPRGFEEVRISTVYGGDGRPAKAGLELYLPDDELPRRLGGVALHSTEAPGRDGRNSLSFFRWSLEGVPAFGLYESLERR